MTILKKQHPLLSLLSENILSILFFLFLFLLIWFSLGNLSESAREEQLDSTHQAVRRAAVQCYALEGSYPADLSYLEENYGLIIDHERYLVHYQSLGSNLMPQIAVFEVNQNNSLDEPENEEETI